MSVCVRKRVPVRLELAAQLAVVVDLAVVHEPQRAVVARERLHGRVAQVDDREPAEPERDAVGAELAVTVGAAMVERARHRAHGLGLGRTAERDDSAEAAHQAAMRSERGAGAGSGSRPSSSS